jgi:metallo-beta-lactamase class B
MAVWSSRKQILRRRRRIMSRYFASVFCVILLLADWIAIGAQVAKAQAHVAAAKAAAYEPGQDFTVIFDLCKQPKLGSPQSRFPRPLEAPPIEPGTKRKIPPRSSWYAEPMKVFNNVYYVGGSPEHNMNVWAVTTGQGIILINAGWDFTVEELVVNGLKKLGLDPAQIKYVVLNEPKPEIYGGARFLQEHYKARVILSEADWDVMAQSDLPVEFKPRKDMIAMDGQKLTLGDVTIYLYITPGHTPGTVSLLISPLKDGKRKHVGSMFGGRGPGYEGWDGVKYYASEVEGIAAWSGSAKRFKSIAERAGADVFLSAHDNWDKTSDKLNALRFRKPGDPHPFVSKSAVSRFQTVISECMDAQLSWRSSE